MVEVLQVLMNRRRLKASLAELTQSQLDEVRKGMNAVCDELEEVHMEREKAEQDKQKKLETALAMVEKTGLTMDDLRQYLGVTPEPKGKGVRSGKPRKTKQYRYQKPDGDYDIWFGLGRTPKALKDAMARDNKPIEHYLMTEVEPVEA